MLQSDPRSVAQAYVDAVGRKEFDDVARLLHPDAQFITTRGVISGERPFIDALRKLAPILVRNDLRTSIVDGDNVAVVYDFVTDTPAGAVPTIEWLAIESGRIRSSRLIFDTAQWPAAVAELQRRATSASS